MLLQCDQELEAKCQRVEGLAREKEEKVKALHEEVEWLEDVAYLCYEQGFNEALA